MKKISLIGACLFAGFSAWAQADLVKEAEHMLKASDPDYKKAVETIKPALSNPETSGTMMPWYLSGKANFGVYDNGYLQESLGNPLSPEQKKEVGHALINGYNDYFKALHLDSIPDAKGKIKPKKSKEIIKNLAGAYPQLRNAGIFLLQAQDYNGAYDAWEIYVTLPENPMLGKSVPKADADTIVGEIMYYQAAAMLSDNQNDKALKKLKQAEAKGYTPVDVYTYAVEAARRLNDTTTMVQFAEKGYEKYGTQEISFIGQLINAKLAANDYPACYTYVNRAIEITPSDNKEMLSQLYDIKGYILEQEEKMAEASDCFNKAVELDPKNAKGYFDLGRVIYNKAIKLDEESNSGRTSDVTDQLLKAAALFEKAYNLDEQNMSQIPNILYRLYYRLGAGYEKQADMWKSM